MNETAKQTVFSTTQNRYFCVLFTLLQKYWDKNTIEQTTVTSRFSKALQIVIESFTLL